MVSVVANLAWLVPGGVGGSEEYATRLLAAVTQQQCTQGGPSSAASVSLRVVASKRVHECYPWMQPLAAGSLVGPLHYRGFRILAESTQVHLATRDADLVHHFGGRMPAVRNPNALLTIHDLQPLDMAANFSLAKRNYLKWALQRSATDARVVCAPSHWVANCVVERFGISDEKVRVVSSTWDTQASHDSPLSHSVLLERLGEGPMLLYPAATHPHKNHLTLLEAVDRLASRHPDLTVVFTGGTGRAELEVAQRIGSAAVRVERLGRVSSAQLSTLMKRADLVAFPSRYEGFGLPLLEAMHAGTPVIAGNNTAMPEVVVDAGLLVSADDVDGWVDAIDAVLTDSALVARLSAAGRLRAERFAPTRVAERLLSVWSEWA